MKRIRYILRRIKGFQFGNMLRIVNKIHQKTGKSRLLTLLDIIYCVYKHGSGYYDYFEFEFYLLNNDERKTYVTAMKNNAIIKEYNDPAFVAVYDDKRLFNERFRAYVKRDFIDLESCSKEDFMNFCRDRKEICAKIPQSNGGYGVDIYRCEDLDHLYETVKAKKEVLIEEKIQQHPDLNVLYGGSVNTLRLVTFLKDDGEAVVLNSVFKIGNSGNVDNFSSGGMYTFVDQNGVVMIDAIDEEGNVYKNHPQTGQLIKCFRVPCYQEAVSMVCKAIKEIPQVRYVGFDVAVGKDGPLIVEGNSYCGNYEMKPSVSGIRQGRLTVYREYMPMFENYLEK